jgi:hypothetical protein
VIVFAKQIVTKHHLHLLKRDLLATRRQGLCFTTNAEYELFATKQIVQHELEVAFPRTTSTKPCSIDASKPYEQPIRPLEKYS